eukprot:360019-Chlamydomonas_euryale.AAC.20
MAGGELECVVVVVPALAKRNDADPPVVARQPKCTTPHQGRQSAKSKEQGKLADNMPRPRLRQPAVEPLALHVGCVGAVADTHQRHIIVQQPSSVAPPEAFVWRVRVQRCVCVQVMVAVAADPLERVSLGREHTAICQCVLEPLRRREGAVAQLTVVAESDAKTAADEVHGEEQADHLP